MEGFQKRESKMSQLENEAHSHCDLCLRRTCHEGCPMITCIQMCGAVFHSCKQLEHDLLCPTARVPCINRENGCPHVMPRHRQGIHLSTCPASVICCTNEWNRKPATGKDNSLSTQLLKNNGSEQLDIALTLRDQHYLNMALEQNNNKELSTTSLATPYCPSQVIRHSKVNDLTHHFIARSTPGLQNSICHKMFGSGSTKPESSSCSVNSEASSIHSDLQTEGHRCTDAILAAGDGKQKQEVPVLSLDLTIDSLTRYQPKQDSIFTFMCAQVFRRDEYASHVKNIHSEIYAGLNGWLVQRCPLACYGCTYSIRRMYPNDRHCRVVYSSLVNSFGIQPSIPKILYEKSSSDNDSNPQPALTDLPTEVLEHIAMFLDGFSLNSLALTCKLLRDVCYNILPEKGVVIAQWQYQMINGRRHWYTARYRWRFSVGFSPINEWSLTCFGAISTHLQSCPYYHHLPTPGHPVQLAGLDGNFATFKNNFYLVNRYYRYQQCDYRQKLVAQQLRLLQRQS